MASNDDKCQTNYMASNETDKCKLIIWHLMMINVKLIIWHLMMINVN